MPPLLEYLAGQTAVIGHDGGRARIRSEPSTQVGEIVDTVAIGGSRSIGPLIGWVRGEDTEGSDRWLAWAEGTAYCYTHAINVRSVSPPAAPDCTAAIEAATAPISAALVEAQARIGAKNTALEAAAAAIQKGRDA